jgi:cell division protein FtsN
MADRYQGRPFPADDDRNRRTDPRAPERDEGDPLAELARLIGQTDPFATMGRANHTVQPRGGEREQYQQPAATDDIPAAGPPPWMQRAVRQERQEAPPVPTQDYPSQNYESQDYESQDDPDQDDPDRDYPSAVHPLHRYATQRAPAPAAEPNYHEAPPFADAGHEADPSRYDDALYGRLDPAPQQEAQYGEAYADDPYGYQDGYDDGVEEDQVRKRRGGMMTVVVVLALAVVGTGAAFAYRTYVGTPRSGEPPIIRADAGPTKIMPTPADATAKLPDRMVSGGDGAEKIVPREEAPVDVNARSGPRVVFPQLNTNTNPPPASSVASNALPPASAGNGTLPSNEPRKIRTLSVKGDQPDTAATPVGAPAPAKPAPPTRSVAAAANANASANTPLSLAPQAGQPAPVAEPRARLAATNPDANPEPAAPATAAASSGYLVQVSSQRNEADAQASFRALQGKFPAVLGSRSPVIKRADLGDKGVYYRALVGPFGSSDEAAQFCGSLKTAGGQCIIQRN